MPVFAFLEYDTIGCPRCGVFLKEATVSEPCYLTFQWGYCPSRYPGDLIYRIGDRIVWRPCRDGIVRGWTGFDGGASFNVGDPDTTRLIVTDYGSDVAHFPAACRECGCRIECGAIYIEHNMIISAWAYSSGRLIEDAPAEEPSVRKYGNLLLPAASGSDEEWPAEYFVPEEGGGWRPIRDYEWPGRTDHFDK